MAGPGEEVATERGRVALPRHHGTVGMCDTASMAVRRHMRRWEVEGNPRFITCSCYRRMQLMGKGAIRDVFARELAAARKELGFRLLAWVAMPEHFHLVLVPPRGIRMGTILTRIKRPVAIAVIARWRELRAPVLEKMVDLEGLTRFWQKGGGYDRNVRDEEELWEKIRYIHRNSVARGLVERATDWAWSSARWYASGEGPVECDKVSERYKWAWEGGEMRG